MSLNSVNILYEMKRFRGIKAGLSSILFSVILSGCLSTSPALNEKYAFHADSKKGLVAILDARVKSSSSIVLFEVDVEKKVFTGQEEVFDNLTSVKTPAYHMKRIPPGNYALVLIQSNNTIGLVRSLSNLCNGPIIEIFNVQPGKVSSVEVRKLKPGRSISSPALSKILRKYPRITAPIGQAELKGYIDANGIPCKQLLFFEKQLKIIKVKPNYA